MPEITLEEIEKKFDSLPENLRLAIIVAGADKKDMSARRTHEGITVKTPCPKSTACSDQYL
jgi:hypothetical protein